MAFTSNQMFNESAGKGSALRCFPTSVQPKEFASGSGTLPALAAVTFNTSTKKWQVWKGRVDEVSTITANATAATAGTFTLTVTNPVTGVAATTAAIPYNATAAQIQTALEALANVDVGDVTAVATAGINLGENSAIVTLTWGGAFAGRDITFTATMGGLTGNAHVLAQATQGGTNEANGTHIIKGFVWPDEVVLSGSGEVLGQVVLAGRIHVDDIPAVAGSYSVEELKYDLRGDGASDVRSLGFIIEGLAQFR